MPDENSMWTDLRDKLPRDIHIERIENSVALGTPDVNLCSIQLGEVWVELKYADDWPVRDSTVFRLKHYTKEQRLWHILRCAAGGSCWVLLRVGPWWGLYWGTTAAKGLGRLNAAQTQAAAVWQCRGTLDIPGLLEVLRVYREN